MGQGDLGAQDPPQGGQHADSVERGGRRGMKRVAKTLSLMGILLTLASGTAWAVI
jgi:hypothetical protein